MLHINFTTATFLEYSHFVLTQMIDDEKIVIDKNPF